MAKTVSTQKGLELELQRRINLALNGGAKTAVENCLKKHIQEDVLDVYQPKVYERRADSSVVSSVREHVLTVKDIGVPNESAVGGQYKTGTNTPLAEMVEKGDVKNIWGSPPDAAYLHPRPFVANTAKEIADGNSAVHGEIVKAIKEQFPDN
mgnify:CR=1 FL=1